MFLIYAFKYLRTLYIAYVAKTDCNRLVAVRFRAVGRCSVLRFVRRTVYDVPNQLAPFVRHLNVTESGHLPGRAIALKNSQMDYTRLILGVLLSLVSCSEASFLE